MTTDQVKALVIVAVVVATPAATALLIRWASTSSTVPAVRWLDDVTHLDG